jgi:biopolymer transport protein ExbD
MARKKVKEIEEPESFVMTPMIDIVFQLIIFFLLVNDMSRAQLEELTLPKASKAIKEKLEDPLTLVLNILPDGAIKYNQKTIFKPNHQNPEEAKTKRLEDLFEARRLQKRYQEGGDENWVKYPVLIRADRQTPFQYIQLLLQIATKHGGVTKVQLGAKMPDPS